MDTVSYSSQQRHAISQLRELTGGSNDETAAHVLQSVDWDVQRAAEIIFGGTDPPPTKAAPVEHFNVDDSEQNVPRLSDVAGWRDHSGFNAPFSSPMKSMFSFLAYPLHFISSIFRFIFGVLHVPFPQFHFGGTVSYRLLGRGPATIRRADAPDRWVRELEEETGAVTISSHRNRDAQVSGVSAGPSTSTAIRRTTTTGSNDDAKFLPDFVLSGYEDFLRRCVDEAAIGCVILVSEEHDDVAEFKRSTLTNPTLVNLIYNNRILVWGGDVRSREAWSASEKLQATTYPFVAFIALQPKRPSPSSSSRTGNSSHALTVISRHQGSSTPSSAPTSAATLIEQIERFLPRVNPVLERLRAAKRERERDRILREEQDRAFRESKDRDRARIMAKIAAEEEDKQVNAALAEQKRQAEDKKRREADEHMARAAKRLQRRRWIRRSMSFIESDAKEAIRIAFSLPHTGRIIHRFRADATITELYAFVDVHLIPSDLNPSDDPASPPEGFPEDDSTLELHLRSSAISPEEYWGYRLLLAYPRREVIWKPCLVQDLDFLKGGGHVVVELFDDKPDNEGGDDGYLSEV